MQFDNIRKINYLDKENISSFEENANTFSDISRISNFKINDSALLVIDMQDYFLKETSTAFVPASVSIIQNVNRLIKFFNTNNRPVILTRHIDEVYENNMMLKWWKSKISEDDSLSRISDDIESDSCRIIIKHQYDVFFKTNIEDFLLGYNVNQIVICGVHTHICCETSARSAFVRGYQPCIVYDATATYNAELHLGTLRNLSHCCSILISTNRLIDAKV